MEQANAHHPAQLLNRAWSAAARRQLLFASEDRDEIQGMVGRVFRPHRLEPRTGAGRVAGRMEHLSAGLLGLSCLEYGSSVDILPGPLDSFYLIQIPLQGSALITAGEHCFESHRDCASLLSPSPDLRMHWREGNKQLIVRIESAMVQRYVDSWCGERSAAPTFQPTLRLDENPALLDLLLSMIEVADQLADSAGRDASRPLPVLPTAQLQYRLMATLLSSQAHTASDRLALSGPPVAPRCVRQVEDYLVAHCGEPVTPESLAALAGVSVRSLFLGFQRYRGVSPMRLLRELRLKRARDELLHGAPGTRVTDVALRWGFCHLGRFSQQYRRAFGEIPRQTLSGLGLAVRGAGT